MKLAVLDCDYLYDHLKDEYVSYSRMFIKSFQSALQVSANSTNCEFDTYSAIDGELPSNTEGYDGIVIMGSKFAAYDSDEWINELKRFIQENFKHGVQMAGICFGHQVIHQALGGQVKKSLKGWGVGVHHYATDSVAKLPEYLKTIQEKPQLSLIVSHQDQVELMAPGFQQVAGSDFCPHALCAYQTQVLTSQPHPEFTADYARQLLNIRRNCIGQERVQQAEASLGQACDSALLLRVMDRFFSQKSA